jgi:chromosome partitioning protein
MKTKIITVANQKGGCGKTTITMNISGLLGRDGKKVLIVDADPQATATRWAASANEDDQFPAMVSGLSAASGKIHLEIKKYIGSFDYIIIDCPPAVDSPVPQSALLISDLVIVPVIPSPADLWATVGIEDLILRMQDLNENLKARIVPNMCQSNVKISKEANDVLSGFKIEKCKNFLTLRTAYREAAVLGGTVANVVNGAKAFEEMKALKEEILNIIEG